MRVCWKCKRKYDLPKGMSDANFCPYCGTNQEITDDLFNAAKNKDQDALAQLYMMTQGLVYTTVRGIVNNDQDAEDVVQDTYVLAFQKLNTLENPSAFYNWIKNIAHNRSIDYLKKNGKIKQNGKITIVSFAELDGDDDDRNFDVEDENAEIPGLSLEEQETKTLVNEMLSDIKDDIRIPLIMKFYEGKNYKEIADELGTTESAIKQRIARGKHQLNDKAVEMEKKGISLRGLAPIPFLLMLLKNMEIHAAAASTNTAMLSSICNAVGATGTAAATAASASAVSSAVSGTAKAAKVSKRTAKAAKTAAKTANETAKSTASEGAAKAGKAAAKSVAKKGIHTVQGKLVAGAVTAAVATGTGAAVYYNTTTIDPMDYMVVTFEGDDGEGEATANFDYEAFEQYRDKKEKTKEDEENTHKMESILRSTLEYSLNKEIHLSNGDKVTLKLQYDADALEEYGYTLSGWKTSRHTVEGLTVYTYPTSFDDLSEEQIENFKEAALNERLKYYDNFENRLSIFEVSDVRLIGISLRYDESSNSTNLYAISTASIDSPDRDFQFQGTIVVEFSNAYFIDDAFNYDEYTSIADDYVTTENIAFSVIPSVDFYTQYDLSDYTRNEDIDGIHYEYIDLEAEETEESSDE